MSETFDGTVTISPAGLSDITISLDAETGDMILGSSGKDGDITLQDLNGQARISLDGAGNHITIRDSDGNIIVSMGANGNLVLGGAGNTDGDLALKDGAGVNRINFDAQNHRMIIRDGTGHEIGRLGDFANLKLGSGGHDGDILLYPSSASSMNNNEDATIHLDANAGDITLRNADCAEEFDIDSCVAVDPGTVMSLASDGRLRPSKTAHEKGVVGVVSGAGNYKPGIILDRQPEQKARQPVALVGKTYVRVNDEGGPIAVGDLLTSSSTPGVAMRASDPLQAFGAVIGKAIVAHDSGDGMIAMIVALQ